MNHQRIYDALMARAAGRKIDGYCEYHHIIPRALGGSDAKTNIVSLTYREHFLAHWLLTKFTTGNARRKMLHALHMMGGAIGRRSIASWQYAIARRAQKDARMGRRASKAARAKMAAAKLGNTIRLGHTATDETKARLRAARTGQKPALGHSHSAATKAKLAAASLGNAVNLGRKQSAEAVAKRSAAMVLYHARRRAMLNDMAA